MSMKKGQFKQFVEQAPVASPLALPQNASAPGQQNPNMQNDPKLKQQSQMLATKAQGQLAKAQQIAGKPNANPMQQKAALTQLTQTNTELRNNQMQGQMNDLQKQIADLMAQAQQPNMQKQPGM